jgi:amidase
MVAARAVPVAHANDGGGSIRIPAAVNGLVGLKPTRGRVPLGPDFGEALAGMAIEFAVTRTVRDCAALLDAVHGAGIGDKYSAAPPVRPFAEEVGAPPGNLKIAFTTEAWSGAPVDPECARAVEELAALLEELGHDVTEAAPDVDVATFDRANTRVWFAFLAASVATFAQVTGNQQSPDNLEATTLACSEAGTKLTALDLMEADALQNQVTRAVASWFVDYDVLLTPTLAHATFPLGLLDADDSSLDAKGWYDKIFLHAPFTALFNMTGQPAMSVPVMATADGGPVGTQLVSRFGDEATLIRLAAQLEEARPWADRKPAVCAGSVRGASN